MSNAFLIIGEKWRGFAAKNLSQRAVVRRLNFMPSMTGGGGRYGVVTAGDLPLRHAFTSTGGALDYEQAAGDVLQNSVVAACVNAIAQALPEAPILLEKRIGGNEFERVDFHPVLDLLHNPNPYLSEAELWGVTTAFERTRGEAFWYFEYGADRTVPREIWFRAPEYVQVISDTARFISGYNITSESGQVVSLDECDVVHFRHQLSTLNPRAGWSPIQTGKRQIVGDNGAATYHSAILCNAGTASLIISLKDAAAAGEVTPGQIDEYVQLFKRKVMGEGSGAILGMDLPLDVHKVGFSPDEMALDKLLEYYESRICALMGVNRRVINLGSDPTYENSKVALNDFWERAIVPMRRRHASTLSSQLLPLFGLDPAQYRLRFDFSEVEALRENVDALHARWRQTFLAGGIDLFTFQEKVGLKPEEEHRGLYSKPSQVLGGESAGEEIKASRSIEWDESEHPRDRDGKFTNGGAGASRALRVQSVSGSAAGGDGGAGGSGTAGGSTGGKQKKQKLSGSDKLRREHGEGQSKLESGKSPITKLVPDLEYTEHDEVVNLIDEIVPNLKSQGHSVDVARNLLAEMHNDPAYTKLLGEMRRIDRQSGMYEINSEYVLYSPEERLEFEEMAKKGRSDLNRKMRELQAMQRDRYEKMWGILCANDSPKFNESGFDIQTQEFKRAERAGIKRGIRFLSKMIGDRAIPPTDQLKFKKGTIERSSYTGPPLNAVEVGTDSDASRGDKMIHEMAHWLAEQNPDLANQVKWHFDRRTAGEPELSLKRDFPDKDYGDNEKYKKDNFIEGYMGKFYSDGQNEILTVGLQYFVLAPDMLAKKDPETFDFIYKLLRGENPEVAPASGAAKNSFNGKSIRHD